MKIRNVDIRKSPAAALIVLAASIIGAPLMPGLAGILPSASQRSNTSASGAAIKRDAFDVVSIRSRPAPAGGGGGAIGGGLRGAAPGAGRGPCASSVVQITPGRFVANNITLYRLMSLSFGKSCRGAAEIGLISGGPSWIRSDTFDIQAVIPEGTPFYSLQQLTDGQAPELQMMLQTMIRDRFKLTVHDDQKEGPAYNLVLVRPGKIKPAQNQTLSNPAVAAPGRGLRPDPSEVPTRGFSFRLDPSSGKASIVATSVRLSTIIDVFQGLDGRFVLDKTGLQGLIDIPSQTLDFDTAGPFEPGAASIWPEVLRQLGLKLEPTQALFQIQVIDFVERPSEN